MAGNSDNDGGFAAFEAAGNVEVGSPDGSTTILPGLPGLPGADDTKPAKPGGSGKPPRAPKPKPAQAVVEEKPATAPPAGDDDGNEDDEGDEPGGEEGEGEEGDEAPKPKPKRTAKERIAELNTRLRQSERLRLADAGRLDALEKASRGVSTPAPTGGNSPADIGDAPNPSDAAKYPLGHLDDRYIEDKLEWLATKKAAERADAVLQRQQEQEGQQQAQQRQQQLLTKVDDLSTRGSEQFDDFQETVVEAGMRGDWHLDQPTFEAAFEAEHGVQILYDLSQDKTEAARVAALTPYQQLKFVADKNDEIAAKTTPRTKPGAGAPPQTQTRGSSSKTAIKPDTDNLDDFEKAWMADAKK